MTQTSRPTSTVQGGHGVTGASTSWQALSDSSDSSYIAGQSGTDTIVKIANLTDPGGNTNYIVNYRWDRGSGTGIPTLQLWQGVDPGWGGSGFQITSITLPLGSGAPGTGTYTLTSTEADSITDFTNLYFQWIKSGGTAYGVAYDLWFTIPDATGPGLATPATVAALASVPAPPFIGGTPLVWTPPRIWTPGGINPPTAAQFNLYHRDNMNYLKRQPARKTADQSVTSSTALVSDTHLAIALISNEVVIFRGVLFYTAGTTGDLKLAINAPSGASGYWGGFGRDPTTITNTLSQGLSVIGDANVLVWGGNGATKAAVWLGGMIVNGATAGNLQLRFAENASDATSTTLLTGSYMMAHRVLT